MDISSKTNNIIIDIDYIFDRDIAIFGLFKAYNLIDSEIRTDTFLHNRVYTDSDVNPLLSILPDQENAKIGYANVLQYDDLDDFRILMESNIVDMVSGFIESQYIGVNFAIYNDIQKEKLIEAFGNNCSFIYKSKVDKINMRKYDTLYIRDYTDLEFYDFSKSERKTIYLSNLRCNFADDEKLTLRLEFLDIGMRNDILCTDIYNNMMEEK